MEENDSCSNFSISSVDQDFTCVTLGHRIFHGLLLALILLCNLALNSTVLVLVCKHKKLRQKSVLVTLGLVLADMIAGVIWVFQAEASIIAGEWPFHHNVCSVFAYLYLTILYVRWCEVLAFTNDRLCQILFPFWYDRWSNWLVTGSTVLAWMVPAVVSIPPVALDYTAFYLTLTACSVNCREDDGCAQGISGLFGFFIMIGGVIPTIMYIFVYFYGWRKKIAMKRRLQMGTGEGIPRSQSFEQNFLQRFNTERRALTTCLLVFITNIATTVLIYVTTALRSREEVYSTIPLEVHFLATYIFLLGTVLDPLVIMRTKDFREKALACFRRKARARSGFVSRALRNVVNLSFSDESSKMTSWSNSGVAGTAANSGNFTTTSFNSTNNATTADENSHTDC